MSRVVIQGPVRELVDHALRVPSDKSLTQRAILFAAVASGSTRITQPLLGADVRAVMNAVQALGADVREECGALEVRGRKPGPGRSGQTLDLANSGTGARLLLGLLCGQGIAATVTGDASLRRRPMERIRKPLERMGARFAARDSQHLPIQVLPVLPLQPFHGSLEVASAQVKSAILLAALGAVGESVVHEPVPTRDHTELLLPRFGVPVRRVGQAIHLHGPATLHGAGTVGVPADPSSAAFFAFLAAALPGSRVQLTGVLANPLRTAFLEVLQGAGAAVRVQPSSDHQVVAEPTARWEVRGAPLRAQTLEGPRIPALIDELPLVAVLATRCAGTTVVRDAAELRHKESDRIQTMVEGLQRMGAVLRDRPEGFEVDGPCPLHGATVEAHGDHRVAMALAVAGLLAEGRTQIHGAECVDVSYPGFFTDLETLAPGSVQRDD